MLVGLPGETVQTGHARADRTGILEIFRHLGSLVQKGRSRQEVPQWTSFVHGVIMESFNTSRCMALSLPV